MYQLTLLLDCLQLSKVVNQRFQGFKDGFHFRFPLILAQSCLAQQLLSPSLIPSRNFSVFELTALICDLLSPAVSNDLWVRLPDVSILWNNIGMLQEGSNLISHDSELVEDLSQQYRHREINFRRLSSMGCLLLTPSGMFCYFHTHSCQWKLTEWFFDFCALISTS